MAYSNVTAEFDQIPERANAASQQLRNAATATKEQLDRELADARARAAADAGRLKAKADDASGNASSHWQEIRRKWQAHVAETRGRVDKAVDQMNTDSVVAEADLAEAYASDAIEFALDAIDEAQYAAMAAYSARASAVAAGA
jgi:hypothetical protein